MKQHITPFTGKQLMEFISTLTPAQLEEPLFVHIQDQLINGCQKVYGIMSNDHHNMINPDGKLSVMK